MKNHETQCPINQILKDEFLKKNFNYTKGFKAKNNNEKKNNQNYNRK